MSDGIDLDDAYAPMYAIFVGMIAAGFSEDQALKMIAYYIFLVGNAPKAFGNPD